MNETFSKLLRIVGLVAFLEISSRSILDIDSVRIKSHKTQIALMLLISPTTAADYDYLMVEVYFIENT